MLKDIVCVILVGGKGSRLQLILKNNLPKSLAPVYREPFLHYQIKLLKKRGFRRFLLCTGIMASKIEKILQDRPHLGVTIKYSKETRPLGTAGALKNAQAHLDKTFFVFNGDTYLDMDYMSLLKFHQKKDSKLTIVITKRKKGDYGALKIDSDKRIVSFIEKKTLIGGYVNAGCYIMEPEILIFIAKGRAVSLEKRVIPSYIKKGGKAYGYVIDKNFYDIGTVEGYSIFKNFIKREEMV